MQLGYAANSSLELGKLALETVLPMQVVECTDCMGCPLKEGHSPRGVTCGMPVRTIQPTKASISLNTRGDSRET